jgi:sporulation protein YlmC with PRC-barrel domain
MGQPFRLAAMTLLAAGLALPVLAQSSGQVPGTGAPNLAVASVRMENGYRASKLIGAPVVNGQNQRIGTIDDIILNRQNRATLAVVSVGGFLGVGAKLVAVPFDRFRDDGRGNLVLADASRQTLGAMPSFTYGQ